MQTPTSPKKETDPPSTTRLLLVADSLDMGGAERYVADLACTLARRGYEVAVACSQPGALEKTLRSERIPVHVLSSRLVKRRVSLTYAWRLRRLILQHRFDVVHAHIFASQVAAALATAGTGASLVLTEHSEGTWKDSFARRLSGLAFRRAGHITAVSQPIGRSISRTYGIPRDKVTVIPNAVAATCGALRRPLPPVCEGRRLIGVLARLQPEKGVQTLLHAVPTILQSQPDAHVLFVGDGPMREELTNQAAALGVTERVSFLGFREDARALLPMLDVLVVPSLAEGAPLAILEAMYAGTPIVATAVGGIPDQVRHDREGLLVPPGEPDALAAAVVTLLDESQYAAQLATAAQERVAKQFSYDNLIRQLETVYNLVQGKRVVPKPAKEGLKIPTAR